MATKNSPAKFDCYAHAKPDEPMFILLARDPWAPDLVDVWAGNRLADIEKGERPHSDLAMVTEANKCADEMRAWRAANWPQRKNDGTEAAPSLPSSSGISEAMLLSELAKHETWELRHGSFEDEEDEPTWCVHERHGNVNDAEWRLRGTGETPADAIRAALLSALTAQVSDKETT